jgi:putative hydrolase of the HAD superfamily
LNPPNALLAPLEPLELVISLSHQLGASYLDYLPQRNELMPGAIEVLEYLNAKYKLHLITNGFDKVQHQKLIHSKIDHFFDTVITSEFAGYKKPQKEIFHFAISEVSAYPNNCIMIGDNIENDIIGASKAGIDQIFYNPENLSTEFTPTHEIKHLIELKTIL